MFVLMDDQEDCGGVYEAQCFAMLRDITGVWP